MTSSKRETVLAALAEALAEADLSVTRNDPLPDQVGATGALILHDGDPGEPEITLSPPTWHYQHRAEIDVFAAGADRDDVFDALCQSVGAAIAADRTLGGACDWAVAEAPRPSTLAEDGALPVKAATVPVLLIYSTTEPLG